MKIFLLLFVFAAGCTSKSSDPTPSKTPVPAFTCVLDGVPYTSSHAPEVIFKKGYATVPQSHLGDDVLYVFVDNSANKGEPSFQANFTKDFGSPDSSYKLNSILYIQSNAATTYYSFNPVGSIQQNSTGTWSGTFTGDYVYLTTGTNTATSHITSGVFTEAKP